MLLLHLSDLHLSRYGESRYWTRPVEKDGDWQTLNTWQGWRVEGMCDRKGRHEKLRLVDPAGVIHETRKWPRNNDDKPVSKMVALAMERHMTSAETLTHGRPSSEDLRSLLRIDPINTNLRFLQLLDSVTPLEPAIIVVTGDLTDNGFGYLLITHYLKQWIEQKRLFVVPGNHDTYDMFPRRGRKSRIVVRVDEYNAFAEEIGNQPEKHGAYVRFLNDVAIVGLSSCRTPSVLLSATGEVSEEQLEWLRELPQALPQFKEARFRLCLMHHHVLRMPMEPGKRSPFEVGLRLRNPKEVMQACVDAKIDILFNGHRHHGYLAQLPGHPLVISSPSSTFGCGSTGMRYVWTVNLDGPRPYPRIHKLSDDPATLAPVED